jgi:hypothetical protein
MASSTTAKRAIASTFVLACPLIAVFFVLKPKQAKPEVGPIPLKAAMRVAAVPLWSESPLSGNLPYQWYTQKAFLYRRLDSSLGSESIAPGEHDAAGDVLRSYQEVGGDLEGAGPTGPADWMLSPDRRWLLTYLGDPEKRLWAAISLDGKKHIKCPARFHFQPLVCWKSDSSGWIELFRGDNGPNSASYTLAANPVEGPVTPLARSRAGYNGRPEVLGGVDGDGMAIATWVTDEQNRIPVRVFHMKQPTVPPIRMRITLPPLANLMETELSPDARRLAWVFVIPDHAKHGLRLPFFKSSTPDTVQQLWTSDFNGGDMRQIAVSDPKTGEALTAVHFVRWLPDGKTVSFVDHDSLYTISAE